MSIETEGILLERCRVNTDFGRGFYLTTRRRQAEEWAFLRCQDRANRKKSPPSRPVVLRFRIGRFDLARLQSMHFVRGDYDDVDYWSLVQHCRQSQNAKRGKAEVVHDHNGPNQGWYDVVFGPVAANWKQRSLMANTDQIGFHTPAALGLLNDLIKQGKEKSDIYSFYEVEHEHRIS